MYKKLKEQITETTQYYLLRNVHPRAEQPFQVRDDEEMEQLVESIQMNGVLNPLIVTPRRGGGYEIVSGHRRYAACQKLGVETIPVIVHDLDPDEATLCMIDSNLHREHLLPSEKAYAYKSKMEVLNRQGQRYGQTSSQPATKWDAATEIGKATNESRDQVFRYIRLTNLIKPLMDIVDSGRIAFTPAVELSYLPHELQDKVVEIFERDEATPSYAQTVRFRRLLGEGKLTAIPLRILWQSRKPIRKRRLNSATRELPVSFLPSIAQNKWKMQLCAFLKSVDEMWAQRLCLADATMQKGGDLLAKISKWKRFLCMARFCFDNKVGGYHCRSQVPEHEILKIVRMYEPIITEFFDNEEEMAKFRKWREEQEKKEEKAKKKAGAA